MLSHAILIIIPYLIWYARSDQSGLVMDLIGNYENHRSFHVFYYFCPQSVFSVVSVVSNSDIVCFGGISTTFLVKTSESISMSKRLLTSEYYSSTFTHKIPVQIPPNSVIYVLDLTCENSTDILRDANEKKLFASPYRWILIHSVKEIPKTDSLVDSEVILATASNVSNFELNKIYKRNIQDELIYEKYGFWTETGGLKIVEGFKENTAVRRKDLNRTVLNTCLVITHNNSYKHLLDKREKHIDTIAKVNYVFMEHIGDLLNAQMNYSVEPTWGYVDNSSNWNGMIGELTKNKADIGGTPLFLTSNRIPIIDYIAMTTPTKSKFVFRQPKLSYITNVFTLPFNTNVWISSVGLVAFTAFALYLVIKWEWYKKRVYGVHDDDKHLTDTELQDSAQDVVLMACSAVCQQGSSAIPYNSSGRVITILLYVSLMFLYTSYSANIVALLQSSSTSIQTLDDLLHSRLQVGVDDTVFNHFFFPNASEPVRRALYLQKVAPPGQTERYFPIEEGVKRMRQGLFAFHMETGAGYKIVVETFLEDEKCGLQEIQFLQVPDPWLAIQKNSSYKEMLKIGLRKIQESGIQSREVALLYTKKPPCISRGSSFIGVSIVDCYPAAVVLAGGAIAATLIFLIEILYYKINTV